MLAVWNVGYWWEKPLDDFEKYPVPYKESSVLRSWEKNNSIGEFRILTHSYRKSVLNLENIWRAFEYRQETGKCFLHNCSFCILSRSWREIFLLRGQSAPSLFPQAFSLKQIRFGRKWESFAPCPHWGWGGSPQHTRLPFRLFMSWPKHIWCQRGCLRKLCRC